MVVVFATITGVSAHFANSGEHAAAVAVVAMIFLYNASYNIMQPLLFVYITEIFPFVHRAKGIAILQFFVRGSTAFNAFVNPIGLDALAWKFYLFYCVSKLVACPEARHLMLFRSGWSSRPPSSTSSTPRLRVQHWRSWLTVRLGFFLAHVHQLTVCPNSVRGEAKEQLPRREGRNHTRVQEDRLRGASKAGWRLVAID